MTEDQKRQLIKWLEMQAYSKNPIDGNPWLDFNEMVLYLPDAINEIMKGEK